MQISFTVTIAYAEASGKRAYKPKANARNITGTVALPI